MNTFSFDEKEQEIEAWGKLSNLLKTTPRVSGRAKILTQVCLTSMLSLFPFSSDCFPQNKTAHARGRLILSKWRWCKVSHLLPSLVTDSALGLSQCSWKKDVNEADAELAMPQMPCTETFLCINGWIGS